MEIMKLTPGDFLKNAGTVGFLRLWEYVQRTRGEEFLIGNRVPDEFAVKDLLALDLPRAYIGAFIDTFGKETKTAKAFERLDRVIRLLEVGVDAVDEKSRKSFQEDLEFISTSLAAASLKSGFEGIKDEIDDGEVYENFVKNKLKAPGPKEDFASACALLLTRLKALQTFCAQTKVRETFLFKTISYTVINNFWTGKCFLLRANAQKKIPGLIKADFTEPLEKYLTKAEYKLKSRCIVCGAPLAMDKEKTSIAFLVDMADDLARKTSGFWNCKPDAFLCPVCAFLYALAPLGFCVVDNGDFVFINANDSVQTLWSNNQPKLDAEGAPVSYHQKIDSAVAQILASKAKIQNNIQVITRSKLENRYHFNVIGRDLIQLTQSKPVQSALTRLAARPSLKQSSGDFINVYRQCIENLLNYRNQYNLLNLLVYESLKQPWVNTFLYPVFTVQCAQLSQKEEYTMDLSQSQYFAAKAGGELRPRLIADKVGRENVAALADDKTEDMIRGVVYQLTNALKVQNIEQFADIIIRLYSSCKLPIPSVFMQALRSGDQFAVIGYAFILGLKGAYYTKENKEGEKSND